MPSRPTLSPTQPTSAYPTPSEKLPANPNSTRGPTLAMAPHLNSTPDGVDGAATLRTSSGRRLSASLVNFFGNGGRAKRAGSASGGSDANGAAGADGDVETVGGGGGTRRSSAGASGLGLALGPDDISTLPPSDSPDSRRSPPRVSPPLPNGAADDLSRSPRSKPPVSLPALFRRRLSSSAGSTSTGNSTSTSSLPAPLSASTSTNTGSSDSASRISPSSSPPSNARRHSRSGSIERLSTWASRSSTFLGRRLSESSSPSPNGAAIGTNATDLTTSPRSRPTSTDYSHPNTSSASPPSPPISYAIATAVPFATSSAKPASRSPPLFDSQEGSPSSAAASNGGTSAGRRASSSRSTTAAGTTSTSFGGGGASERPGTTRRSSGYGFFRRGSESSDDERGGREGRRGNENEENGQVDGDSGSEGGDEGEMTSVSDSAERSLIRIWIKELNAADFIAETSPASSSERHSTMLFFTALLSGLHSLWAFAFTPDGPFASLSRALPPTALAPLDSPNSETSHSSGGSPSIGSPPSSSIYERRMSANATTPMALPGIGQHSPSLDEVASSTGGDSTTTEGTAATTTTAATIRRLSTLPRLLSSDAYSFPTIRRAASGASPAVREEEDTETDTDTDADADDNFASADEGERRRSSHEESPSNSTTRRQPVEAIAAAPPPPVSPPLISASTRSAAPTRVTGRPSPFGNLGMAPIPSSTDSAPAQAVPSTWVTFDPLTPTPGPLGTARPVPEATNGSYFDLPRGVIATRTPRTPGAPLMSPLVPMSLGHAARGRRPERQDEVSSSREPSQPGSRDRREGQLNVVEAATGDLSNYRRRSRSAVAVFSPSLLDSDDQPAGTAAAAAELDPVWRGSSVATPGPSFLASPPITKKHRTPAPSPSRPKHQPTPSPTQKRPGTGSSLNRRRSMYELHVAPPSYQMVYQRPGVAAQIVLPREEEGQEGLPDYTCAVHYEAYMPRKMEFTAPSVQAKDRSWKRQYIVLHGTSIKIYKFDLKTHPIRGEMDWSGVSADIAGSDGPPPLHFHEGEYGAGVPEPGSSSNKFPSSITDARAKARSHLAVNTVGGSNTVIRNYSLQNAESGLAADYIKRRHVVRVRAAGEQFLLQAKDDRGVIDLIEALQAATNVSLDLDSRPLPRFITLPRRRRRRRRPVATADGTAAPGGTETTAPDSSRQEESRLGDMLAEEQQQYVRAGAQGIS